MNRDQHIKNLLISYSKNISHSDIPNNLNKSFFSSCFYLQSDNLKNLRIYILLDTVFPNSIPYFMVCLSSGNILEIPSFLEILDQNFIVKSSFLPIWNINSKLEKYTEDFLLKITPIYQKYFNELNQKTQNQSSQIGGGNYNPNYFSSQQQFSRGSQGQIGFPNNQQGSNTVIKSQNNQQILQNENNISVLEESQYNNKLKQDLSNRSLDELLLINNNLENYIESLFTDYDSKNLELCNEVLKKKGKKL